MGNRGRVAGHGAWGQVLTFNLCVDRLAGLWLGDCGSISRVGQVAHPPLSHFYSF